MFRAIDDWFLNQFDGFVMWLWNTFSVPKIAILRVAGLGWMAISTVLEIHHKSFGIWSAIFFIILLCVFFGYEYNHARLSPRMMNEYLLRTRVQPVNRTLRFTYIALFLILSFSTYNIFLETMLFQLGNIAWIIWILVTEALVPEDPPKRKEKEVLLTSAIPEV